MLAHDDHDPSGGSPLVLIHGLAASRTIWRQVAPQLARRHRVIALDVPGFGASPPAGRGFSLEAVAAAIWEGLPEDLPRATIVGHSMGGAVAMAVAAAAPERVDRLVLCASAGFWRPVRLPVPEVAMAPVGAAWDAAVHLRRRAEVLAAWSAGRRLLLGISTAPGNALGEDDVRAIVRASAQARRTAQALHAVATRDLRELCAELPVPVGLLWGGQDWVVPQRALEAARAVRPDAPVAVVDDAGHLVMLERPAAFTAALDELLDSLAGVHSTATRSR